MSLVQQYEFNVQTIRPDGMVNATALATAYRKATVSEANPRGVRKDVRDWLATPDAKASIAYLERVTGTPVTDLVIVQHGVGTWVHPDLAEILAQWICVEYRFAVVALIRQTKATKTMPPQLPKTEVEWIEFALAEKKKSIALAAELADAESDVATLSEIVDELHEYSSIIRIAKYNKVHENTFTWRKLKTACTINQLEVKEAPCPRYGTKKLWPHEAWRLTYPGYRLPDTTTLVIQTKGAA